MVRGGSLRIRLQRFGRPYRPFYRIVACERDAPRDGKFLEILGTYSPLPDQNGNKQVTLKVDSVKRWIMKGAEPSDRVAKILGMGEILPPFPRKALLRDPNILMAPPEPEPEPMEEDEDSSEADSSSEAAEEEGDASGSADSSEPSKTE